MTQELKPCPQTVAYLYEHATHPDDYTRTLSFDLTSYSADFVCRPLVYQIAHPGDGWKLVRVNEHFDALIASLERAESKGYLPDAMAEEWAAFDYNLLAASTASDKQEATWAPDRIWLQRGVGEEGSHTWCEHQIGEDSIGDSIEEAEYVRADAASLGKQEPVAEVIKWRTFTGHTAWDFKVFDQTLEHGAKLYTAPPATPSEKQEANPVAWFIPDENGKPFKTTGYSYEAAQWKVAGATVLPLYAAPLAQSAEQDRIDAERWRYALKYWLNPIDLKNLDALVEKDKGASK
jgi:hypothetical protein